MSSRQIRLDLFPASISFSKEDAETQEFDKVRVVLTLDHIYVFSDQNAGAPKVVFSDTLVSYTPPIPLNRVRKASQLSDRSAHMETGEGFEGVLNRMSGCACGTRLKTLSIQTLMDAADKEKGVENTSSIAQVVSKNDEV